MNLKVTTSELCEKTGMSRQNFYKGCKQRQRRQVDADLIEELVTAERSIQPRLGGKKLYYMLKSKLLEAGVELGRDRFFEVLKEKGLLLERLPKAPRTTNSRHSLPVFVNRLADMTVTGFNQAWVSDITYIRTDEGFLYLSLITDDWSRKIVGYHAGTLRVRHHPPIRRMRAAGWSVAIVEGASKRLECQRVPRGVRAQRCVVRLVPEPVQRRASPIALGF